MESFIKNDILIKKAKIEDLGGILKLNFNLFKKEYKEYDKSLNLKWTYNEGKKYFKNRIMGKNSFVEIAELKGKIIGYLCGGISEREFFLKKAKYAELENMSIEKSFRGRGIGTKLAKNFMNWCRKNRVYRITVKASAKNREGISFYKKIGFKDHDLTLEMFVG